MAEITLQAEIRNVFGKRVKALRLDGIVPGVYYAHGESNIPIAVKEVALRPLISATETHIINLQLDDGKHINCILRDVQFHAVTDEPIHFDLQGVRADEEVTIEIPVVLKGTATGVREGGILQHVIHKLKISCLPKDLPEHIEVDIENLGMNQAIHVRDLEKGAYTMLESEDSTVVSVVPPAVVKEEVPVEEVALEPAEPEVISKGKKVEEGEEAKVEEPKEAAPRKEESKE